MPKFTNVETFQGKQLPLQIGRESDYNHGFHVAGIIASPCLNPQQKEEFIGVAPGSKIELYNIDDLRPATKDGVMSSLQQVQREFSAEDHAFLMDLDLAGEKENNPGSVTYKQLGDCFSPDEGLSSLAILNSGTSIINRSVADSGLERFSRSSLSRLELDANNMFTVRLLANQGKLFINSAGNESIYLATTKQYRFIKAMAYSKQVSPQFIMVGNLMQDGLTINSTSNQPGDDTRLQERFLMACGTNILSHAPLANLEQPDHLRTKTGTSMAAPFVSGAAAIVMRRCPNIPASEVASCLLEGATPILVTAEGQPYDLSATKQRTVVSGTVLDQYPHLSEDILRGRAKYGMGRLNVENALKRADEFGLLM